MGKRKSKLKTLTKLKAMLNIKKTRKKRKNAVPKQLRGYGFKKKKGTTKKKNRGQKIKVDSKQLAGLSPMNTLDLYKSQLATGIPT